MGEAEFTSGTFPKLPSDWQSLPLGQLASVRGGKRMPKGRPFAPFRTPYPYLRVSDMKNGTVLTEDIRYVLPEDREDIKRYTISAKDVYITIAGTLGAVGLVPASLDGAQLTENAAKIGDINTDKLDQRYLVAWLASDLGQRQIGVLKGVGSGVPKLALFRIESVVIGVPPLGEQRKIAAILSSVDDAIESTQAVIDQLQVVKKAMMAALLTRGLPGRHTRFKDTEIGEMPEEWEVSPVGDLVHPDTTITYGIVQAGPHVAAGIPYIRTGDVKPSGILDVERLGRTSPEIAAKFERSRVRTGDLVVCIRASVGAVASVPAALDGANLTQGTARISPGPRVAGPYLLWALRSQAVQDWIDLQCKGSTFREITLGRLRQVPIPVPDTTEQEAIAGSLDAAEERIRVEERAQETLRGTKSALMSVLLTGELRVTPDEAAA